MLKIIGLKENSIKLTELQKNQINDWCNNWKTIEEEWLIDEIESEGIHIQDVVEWMDEVTRKRVFGSTDYYRILGIENKIQNDLKKAFWNKQIFIL